MPLEIPEIVVEYRSCGKEYGRGFQKEAGCELSSEEVIDECDKVTDDDSMQ